MPGLVPSSVKKAALAVAGVVAIHFIALILLQMHGQEISATLRQLHPGQSLEAFQQSYRQAVTAPSIVHIVLPLLILLALRSAWVKHTPWSRVRLTLLLLFQILAHATIPLTVATLPAEAPTIIAVQSLSFIFEVSALALLWFPRESRNYFRKSH